MITITNEKIISFYKENPSIDITEINLVFIDILKQLSTNLSTTIGNTVTSQIFNIVTGLKSDIKELNTNFALKLHDIKKEYIDDIKLIISNTEHNTQDNINNILDKSIENLVIKINEIIPKSQDKTNKQIEQCIKSHCDIISQTTNKILQLREQEQNSGTNKEIVDNIEKSISTTISSLQQSINTCIQNNELKTQSNIQQLNEKLVVQKQVQETLNTELTAFLNKYKTNSSVKGAVSEIELYHALQKIVPCDEIIRCSSEPNTCDIKLNRKNNSLPTILFESKDYIASVNSDEVAKFERDLQIQKCHGIFISQNSPITFKESFHIDIIKGLIHLYIPNANYDIDKIKLAIYVIDNLSEHIHLVNNKDNKEEEFIRLSQNDYENIKEEYIKFANKKTEMIDMIRTVCKQLIEKLEEIQLPLIKRITGNSENIMIDIPCTRCNKFMAKNKASLSAHQKKCKPSITVST